MPFHGVQLQLVGAGFLAWQQVLAVDVVVHHQNVRLLVRVLADNDRAGFQPHRFRAVVAAMPSDDLVGIALARAHDHRLRNAVALDAVHEPHKVGRRAVDAVRLAGVGENLACGDDLHALALLGLALCVGLEQVIERSQTDVF